MPPSSLRAFSASFSRGSFQVRVCHTRRSGPNLKHGARDRELSHTEALAQQFGPVWNLRELLRVVGYSSSSRLVLPKSTSTSALVSTLLVPTRQRFEIGRRSSFLQNHAVFSTATPIKLPSTLDIAQTA